MWLDMTSWMRGSTPLVPPELARPYASQADKEADWQRLLQRAEALKELTELADIPERTVRELMSFSSAELG